MVMRRVPRWRIALVVIAVGASIGFTAVSTNVLGAGERFDRLVARVEAFIDPPPDRPTLDTVRITPIPAASPTPRPEPSEPQATETPSPTPAPVRSPVDVNVAGDPQAVFASQLTTKDCAVAGTQMVLAILGLGDTSAAFQTQIHDRIGEWESVQDSLNGGWGPAAVSLALAAYGAPG
jgi:hypothetical protein